MDELLILFLKRFPAKSRLLCKSLGRRHGFKVRVKTLFSTGATLIKFIGGYYVVYSVILKKRITISYKHYRYKTPSSKY
jgi:hypothetical protein